MIRWVNVEELGEHTQIFCYAKSHGVDTWHWGEWALQIPHTGLILEYQRISSQRKNIPVM